MLESLSYILAFMITLPFLITYIVYLLSYKTLKKKWYSIHLAVNTTTILYIISVGTIIYALFSINPFGYIIILLLFILIFCIFVHWKLYTDIIFSHVWKRFWKVTFLLFFTLHFISMLYGLFYNITLVL
ncbi:DUF3397 domain-containing protein [Gracilibacillus massiliensis]|uniref:DUF3397 domain-containing protein n=1 Tax=Gracilibacillus massiliensis TaxID=1564956 RepID=UPI00071D50E3|nr:DUF3397 domain-containing protein [Gracilibacillus massiliensis]